MLKSVWFAFCALALTLILSACGAVPAPANIRTETPKVMRIGAGSPPDIWDPQKSSVVNEIAILQLAYEGLLSIDEKGNIGPGAADRWELTPDAMQMTFHIRDGLTRSDGTPMACADFEYALKREVDPTVPGKLYTSIVYDIKGAEELDALATDDPSSIDPKVLAQAWANYGVKCISPQILQIQFKKPTGFWAYVAATWVTYPTDARAVQADPETWWLKPQGHNGNGPYTITEIIEGKKIVFEANPHYWQGKPKIERIEYYFSKDNRELFEAYKKGELEIAAVAPESLDEVSRTPELSAQLLRFPSASTSGFTFNHTNPIFKDKNVRIAFSQALDRKAWVNDVLKGIGEPYTRWLPPGVPGAQSDVPGVPDTDFAGAVKTLVDNGYAAADSTPQLPKVDCAKLPELVLTYPASPLNHARFEFIAGNLIRALGCPVTLEPVEPTVYRNMTKDPKTFPLLAHEGWIQDYPHPSNWLSVYWTCEGFASRSGYCNPEFDALTARADASTNFEEAIELYQDAENVLLSDVPSAFMSYGENVYLVKPYVIGPSTHTGSSDATWPGQYGPVNTYEIDLTKVGSGYPKQ